MQLRALPERPNLDHLKNEAKTLLETLRQSDPAAKLTDAQRALARAYGFPTWARLRSHVQAARSTTDTAIDAFLSAIQDQDRGRAMAIVDKHPAIVSSSLHVAAALGATDEVRRLLTARPAAVHEKAGTPPAEPLLYLGFSPLHGESPERDAGLLASTRTLLEAGADPNTKDSRYGVAVLYGVTGMHNSPKIARVLLESGASPNDGESVFHAAERFHIEALELLREFGVDLNYVGEWGNTALYFVLNGHDPDRDDRVARGVDWLLANGADPNIPCGKERENSLHAAVRRGRGERTIRKLLEHGADVKAPRGDGLSALRLAKRGGYDEIAAMLERAGAEAETMTAADQLLAACGRGDADAARRLASPQLVASLRPSDRAIINEAARAGRAGTVAACIAAGFNVNEQNDRGALPIHEAAISGHARIVSALIAAGSNLSARDPEHRATPLGWAVFGADYVPDPSGDYEATIRALIAAGAKGTETEGQPRHPGARAALGLPPS